MYPKKVILKRYYPALWKEGKQWFISDETPRLSSKRKGSPITLLTVEALARSGKQRLTLALEEDWGMEEFYSSPEYVKLRKGKLQDIFSLCAKFRIDVP